MNKTPTLIIDSNFLGYQSHYTMDELTHDDHATGIIFGFLSRILFLAKTFNTNSIVFCWDSKFSKRKKMMPCYKEKRKKDLTEEEIENLHVTHKQFRVLKNRILPEIGFKNVFQRKYYESDDLIAALTKTHFTRDFIIVTADADLYQLIRQNVKFYNPSKKEILTYKKFRDRFGIVPEQWPWIKAIAGCKSDCVPGIKGIGEASAIKYLTGELKKGSKKFEDIKKHEQKYLKINSPIVHLPLAGVRVRPIEEDKLSFKRFKRVCRRYGIVSFLRGEQKQMWKEFLR